MDNTKLADLAQKFDALNEAFRTYLTEQEEVKDQKKRQDDFNEETCWVYRKDGSRQELLMKDLKTFDYSDLREAKASPNGYNIKYANGSLLWCNREAQLHSVDGHYAFYNTNTDVKQWYNKGQVHREDGPAFTCEKEGREAYYQGGQMVEKDQWLLQTTRRLPRLTELPQELLMEEIALTLGLTVEKIQERLVEEKRMKESERFKGKK